MHGQKHTGLTSLWSLFEVWDTKSGFPTTMDGKAQRVYTLICVSPPWWTEKAQCVYTLICVSPPRRTAKHNVFPCLLRLCAVIAVSEPDHHADGARRLTIPPPPTHYFCLSISQVCPCSCGTARGLWTWSLKTCQIFCSLCLYSFQVSLAFAAPLKTCVYSALYSQNACVCGCILAVILFDGNSVIKNPKKQRYGHGWWIHLGHCPSWRGAGGWPTTPQHIL